MPKVSVIMPTFNCEQYVEESILSVVHQTERDLEIIVVDDGSTDGTLGVLDCLAATDNRIHIQRGPHTGYPGVPRNRGLALARGEYISFLDSDDLYYPEKISRVLAVLESIPDADLLFHDFGVLENDPPEATSYLTRHDFLCAAGQHLTEAGPKTYICDSGLYSFMSIHVCPFHMSSVTFHRSLLNSGDFRLREDIHVGDDGDFWLRLAMQCRAVFLDEVLSSYRKRPGSISSDPVEYLTGAIQIHTENLQRGRGLFQKKDERLYRSKIAALLFDLGYAYFCRSDRREAGMAYRQSLAKKCRLRTLTAYLKTFAPAGFVRRYRRQERGLS